MTQHHKSEDYKLSTVDGGKRKKNKTKKLKKLKNLKNLKTRRKYR
jgi:hypothetical protein